MFLLFLTAISLCFASHLGVTLQLPPQSDGDFINSGTPGGVPLSFDCTMREYAWEYGKQLQPRHGNFVELFDALQLSACNHTRPSESLRKPPRYDDKDDDVASSNCTFYVSSTSGSDSNDGRSPLTAFASIERGVQATRSARNGNVVAATTKCVLNLMQGTYHQKESITLDASDSYLRVQNYAGEYAVISGGVALQFVDAWKAYSLQASQWMNYTDYNNVFDIASGTTSNDQCIYLGMANSYDECLRIAVDTSQYTFYSVTWYEIVLHCYGVRDIHWAPVKQAGVMSGHWEGRNIWAAQVANTAAALLHGEMPGLRVNGKRAIRARYPNQDAQTAMQFSPLSGWITYATQWIPPPRVPKAMDVVQNASDWPGVIWPMSTAGNTTWTGEGDWGDFHIGVGGPCASLTPPFGYWCSADAPRHITQHESPSGMYIDGTAVLHAPYRDLSSAVIHSWRPAHWYTWMWNVSSYDAASGKVVFDAGGFQGGEGESVGAEWYIENVMEELDAPNEYFYNSSTNTLYYYHNGTAPPSALDEFVAVRNSVLFNLTGNITNVTFAGVEFADTAITYLEAHGLPSGGDWSLQRIGALTLWTARNVLIAECNFTRIDGIAISVNGYARHVTIADNDFSWLGESAIASWGYTRGLEEVLPGAGPDGRSGEQPRGTLVANNMVREVGIFEKQSSMYFQAQSAQTRLVDNIFFNGPRAAINVNDGFGGDNHLRGNLLLNTCRESGDHGPYNSWDRVPYITTIGNGSASIIPAYQRIYNNFIIGTYQVQEGIDTDDGSSYYATTDNFFVYGDNGMKNDFGGHDNHHIGNVYAYVANAWTFCCLSGADDIFANNSVILRGNRGYDSDCNLPAGTEGMIVENNAIYTINGQINGNDNVCGMSFAQWQSQGHDPGTHIYARPTDDEIIAMGKKLLNEMNKN